MDEIFFEVNNIMCGYDGVLVFKTNEDWHDEIIGSFENILLKKITPNYAIFYLSDINEYLKFDGDVFSEDYNVIENENINNIDYKIIKHDDKNLEQQVIIDEIRFMIDGIDLINNIGEENDFHWGVDVSDLLEQKANFYEGKMLIGLCGCTCEGCDDIIATIATYDNKVYWDVHHEVGGGPIKMKHRYFIFEKEKYENIFEKIEKISTQE